MVRRNNSLRRTVTSLLVWLLLICPLFNTGGAETTFALVVRQIFSGNSH
jgi:hypothetical protein